MIVVDASLAAKWLFPEMHSAEALALANDMIRAGERLVGPPFLPIEVANVVRQRMRRTGIDLDTALEVFEQFLAVPMSIHSVNDLLLRALTLADQYQLPAVYDAHYVALAQALNCELWTADQRLVGQLAEA